MAGPTSMTTLVSPAHIAAEAGGTFAALEHRDPK